MRDARPLAARMGFFGTRRILPERGHESAAIRFVYIARFSAHPFTRPAPAFLPSARSAARYYLPYVWGVLRTTTPQNGRRNPRFSGIQNDNLFIPKYPKTRVFRPKTPVFDTFCIVLPPQYVGFGAFLGANLLQIGVVLRRFHLHLAPALAPSRA